MELTRNQPLNIFDQHRAQTWQTQIITYLLMTSGILISVWLIWKRNTKQTSKPQIDLGSKPGHGWSLDLTAKDL